MQLDEIGTHGTTNPRKRFWDSIRQLILASQKREGRNVSVDVHEGFGSLISVNPQRSTVPSTACCQISLTFHDVLLDCGCIDFGAGGSVEIIEDGFFNDNPVTICVGGCPDEDLCNVFTNRGESCYCGNVGDHHFYHLKEFSAVNDCSGDPSFEGDVGLCGFNESVFINLQLISGTWHLAVTSFDGSVLLFYGTAADLSSTFTNQVTDCETIPTIPDFCIPSPFPIMFIGAHDGTATFEVLTTACGACCYDSDCTPGSTNEICTDLGGVYQGDGTSCEPNPCGELSPPP